MSEKKENDEKNNQNSNKLIGPGLGFVIIGISYLVWWLAFGLESAITDPRWAHNYAYAIIILNVGLAWYHKSPLSRTIAMIQSMMLPITGSGSFNTVLCSLICMIIFGIWGVVVLIEKNKDMTFLDDKLSKRGVNWLNMHTLVLAWILIGHMGLMFFIVRLPLEANLYYNNQAGYLMNLPPESLEFGTWVFDIGLFVLTIVLIWEQYKMGYNIKNNPWPKTSFYIVIIIMVASLLSLLIQDLTIGFDWVETVYE